MRKRTVYIAALRSHAIARIPGDIVMGGKEWRGVQTQVRPCARSRTFGDLVKAAQRQGRELQVKSGDLVFSIVFILAGRSASAVDTNEI